MDTLTPGHFDVVVIGAGPAGMAAAVAASDSGASVALIDDNPSAGGQIWRGEAGQTHDSAAATWFERLGKSAVKVIRGARVFHIDGPIDSRMGGGALAAETAQGILSVSYGKLILATGARERVLPFPGWTLPNVFGAGGLQALMKTGLDGRGKAHRDRGDGAAALRGRLVRSQVRRERGGHLRTDDPEENGPVCGRNGACTR